MSLLIEPAHDFETISAEWENLDGTTSPRLPFTSALWNRLWWQHFQETRLHVRDSLRLFVARDSERKLRGVLPMMLTERPAHGPLRLRMLQFLGADRNLTEVRGPVCSPADHAAVFSALLSYLELRPRDWDWVFLSGIYSHTAAPEIIGPRSRVQWGRQIPDYYLTLPGSWEAFKSNLGRNVKESLRKCYNSLKRDGLGFDFVVEHEPGPAGVALEAFFELHAARSRATDTIQHLDVFRSERSRRFLREYVQIAASRNQVRIFQLKIAGKVVAIRLAFALGDTLYFYFSGFDPEWGKYSVMTTTVAEALKWAIENRFTNVNLSPGKDVSKTRWDPQEFTLREATLSSPAWRGLLAYELYSRVNAERLDPTSKLSRLISVANRKA